MNKSNLKTSRAGVTLIEMLVVIGIIVLLAALLTPAAYSAIVRARNFAMSSEITGLMQAIEKYKLEIGDYPPSFGDTALVLRHMRKSYPKVDPAHLNDFITRLNNAASATSPYIDIDQSEALVFWLSATRQNPVLPFHYPAVDPADGVTPVHYVDDNAAARNFFDFDARRLEDPDGDGFPSFRPQYAKATYYVYIDSRMYLYHMNFPVVMMATKPAARAEGTQVVRPYFSDTFDQTNPFGFKFMNPTTYQILCAGQDGEWAPLLTPVPDTTTTVPNPRKNAMGITRFPSGRDGRGSGAPVGSDPNVPSDGETGGVFEYANTAYPNSESNSDNLANFSEGRTFKAAVPAP